MAAAAALALARLRQRPALLVDADDPAHGMGGALGLGAELLPSGAQKALQLELKLPDQAGASVAAARLCAAETRAFLEELLAAQRWRKLLEDDSGAKVVAAMGMPLSELLGILDCVQPPPGAEMPVALARLLRVQKSPKEKKDLATRQVVVDAGAAALAVQLQSVPPAVADGLGGFLKLQDLLKAARKAAVPSAVASGLRMLVGVPAKRDGWRSQFATTVQGLELLREDMASLAAMEKGVLLVLPFRPGRAGEQAACRTIERLKPICIALTGHCADGADVAPRPPWLPPGPAVVTLPWNDERPAGIDELHCLADAMLAA